MSSSPHRIFLLRVGRSLNFFSFFPFSCSRRIMDIGGVQYAWAPMDGFICVGVRVKYCRERAC